jgi:DNA-binding response OmpR family regulator
MNNKIVLMADNLPSFLDERREFLKQAGYTVVTADNPMDTERILKRGGVDLAILDIRLVNDDDEEDTSGLELAQKFGQKVPIIMLTGFPTWENVKTSLGRDLNGMSPAVDFLSKEESPNLMIQTVNLTIEHPSLKRNMLLEFQSESSQALHEILQKNEPPETTEKFQKSLERTERDLLQYRKEISQQSGNYQRIAISTGLVGVGVIFAGTLLVFLSVIPFAMLSGAVGVVAEAISILFIKRAVQASKQVDENYKELQEIYKASHLISICDTIESKPKREDAKVLIIEKLAGKWFE